MNNKQLLSSLRASLREEQENTRQAVETMADLRQRLIRAADERDVARRRIDVLETELRQANRLIALVEAVARVR